jgi:hypothetical protein
VNNTPLAVGSQKAITIIFPTFPFTFSTPHPPNNPPQTSVETKE